MIYKLQKPRRRPYWASPAIWKKTTAVVGIGLLGHTYELPVTDSTRPILALLEGKADPWECVKARRTEWRRAELVQNGMRDLIQALHCQVEAVAVAGAAGDIRQEIAEKLEPLIHARLERDVEERKALPAPGNGATT